MTELTPLRPPAVPLVACDPYFSIWSCANCLTDQWPQHWTGRTHALCGMLQVDGQVWRIMGSGPEQIPAMPQISVEVFPTRSVYVFQTPQVQVTLTFTTPALPHDLEAYALPITYITLHVSVLDGQAHEVQLYLDASGEIAVDNPEQEVTWAQVDIKGLTAVQIGSVEQPVLAKSGDDLRIDWGYLYLATSKNYALATVGSPATTREAFAAGNELNANPDTRMPRAAGDDQPLLALTIDLGTVTAAGAKCMAILAYDDIFSIEYMGVKLPAWWRRKGANADDLLNIAVNRYPELSAACVEFDTTLMADLQTCGGEKYARLCALAWRQTTAACKLVASPEGKMLLFSKENFSNGCIATVDVAYPMMPQFLLTCPELARAALRPVLEYAISPRWQFNFAPHDLGTYPLANGQVYGGGEQTEENQMPVEECGNMLILMTAIAYAEGNADFIEEHWLLIERWAHYLEDKGIDPEHQLCTDDFAGHLAHNVNLSAKAIVALACFGRLCEMLGEVDTGKAYLNAARTCVKQWMEMADDGDHTRLAFDKPDTWSQKYNLVWDSILSLELFPAEIKQREMDFYRKVQRTYGLPLDSRQNYTKTDWNVWTATLTQNPEDFDALFDRVYAFLHETPSRVPITDWYTVDDAQEVNMQARPVIGGVFIKMLYDSEMWGKWVNGSERGEEWLDLLWNGWDD